MFYLSKESYHITAIEKILGSPDASIQSMTIWNWLYFFKGKKYQARVYVKKSNNDYHKITFNIDTPDGVIADSAWEHLLSELDQIKEINS